MGAAAVLKPLLLSAALLLAPLAARADALPPPTGPSEPRVEAVKGEDGLWHQRWFVQSFLNLREDFDEARVKGKRFAVIFEQAGCPYCTKMHLETLAARYINDYARENFDIVQLDLRGSREVTDFDGQRMPESKLAERWGVMFTPWIVFFKESLEGLEGKWGQALEVTRMGLGMGPGTFYDMFTWVRARVYARDKNFQRFHVARHAEREAVAKAGGAPAGEPVKAGMQ
jgi:hypothetical protein